MEIIKRLPRTVYSTLRSSIILFDLPRVVEELIYNSVDAGATKVFVYIGIKACYIKVEDDGCGITRDGLVILGERYVTSKLRLLADMETSTESLGFRGEALSSLSDVSLLEIRSKARGKPNAYCKILKGSRCLFLGIDDEREVVGTTVIVRDLFYNQPVRRKYMQSSPKRVLHSVKKCVLRTALVHPQVSFKVTDVESEDELLRTVPSSSPLSLVSDGFGNEISSSLNEIAFSDQLLMLFGYISGPEVAFSTRAFQYIYINSRFVCKGQIHNLLNSLAASFQCSLSQQQLESEFHGEKRRKTQGYPAYMLNLCCPLSSYDLNFEPSKTVVEFKDWDTVLSFFEQTVRRFWKQLPDQSLQGKTFTHGKYVSLESDIQKEEMFAADTSKSSKMRKRKCNFQFHQDSPTHSSKTDPLDISSEDTSIYEKHGGPSKQLHGFSSNLKPCRNETSNFGQSEYSFQNLLHDSLDVIDSTNDHLGCGNSDPHQLTPDIYSLLPRNDFFSDQTIMIQEKYDMSPLVWKKPPARNLKKESTQNLKTSDPYDMGNNAQYVQYSFDCPSGPSKPGIKSYSSMEIEGSSAYCPNHSRFGFEFEHLGKDFSLHDSIDADDDNYCSDSLNCRDSPFQKNIDACRPSLSFLRKCQTARELDVLSTDSIVPFTHDQASLTEEKNLHTGLAAQIWETGSKCVSPEAGWFLGSPHSVSVRSPKTGHNFTHWYTSKGALSSSESVDCGHSGTKEEKVEFLNPDQKSCNEVLCTMRCMRRNPSLKRNMHYDWSLDNTFEKVSTSRKLDDETSWLASDMSNIKNTDSYLRSAFHISVQNHDKVVESPWCKQEFQNCRPSHNRKERSRRSCSAPPFYKGKCKFSIVNDRQTTIAGYDPLYLFSYDAKIEPGTVCLSKNISQPCCISQPYLEPIVGEIPQPCVRECIDERISTHEMNRMQNEGFGKAHYNQLSHNSAIVDSFVNELEYGTTTLTKWRTGLPQPTDGNISHNYPEQKDDILDVSSGLLHLSGGSLVPESISKVCLENARVLLQLDRKFIPVMAGGTLIVIDQHAADERIRLEELRRKVLSGEGNSITYLDSEQELVLPEMGFQLLQKYAEQIQKWGWICNSRQCAGSFAKSMKLLKGQKCCVALVAVPCILGINLTDKDLIEYIEQLVETDGSSTLPPSVLRILNFKACRGAIMFGDPLLPSECSLILEELRATSLCFQCAHGRPTTVPLLNMASLHEQLARLEMQKGSRAETWHGLRRHEPSAARARRRLDSAKGFRDDG